MTMKKSTPSKIRKSYTLRLIGRCFIFLCCIALALLRPEAMSTIAGWGFFKGFSILHLLWGIWMLGMVSQLIPIGKNLALGSEKLFRHRFQPPEKSKFSIRELKAYIVSTTQAAYKVFALWVLLLAVIGLLYWQGIISDAIVFLISVAFYVCDLICVLVWCPFRLIMKNKCCSTCRIFNWDHIMMFSPLVFIGGFYCLSLFAVSVIVWLVWELCVYFYPERFWEYSNAALKCSNCTDKLCTQYCQKLR